MPLSLRLITSYHLSVACTRDFPCTYNLHNYPHKKKSAHLERSMRHTFPNYPRRFRIIEHPMLVLGGGVLPRLLPQLDHSKLSVARSLTTTIRMFSVGNRQSFRTHFLHNYSDGYIYSMFFRMSRTIFPSIYSSQLSV